MKKFFILVLLLTPLLVLKAQALDPVNLMLSFQDKYAGKERFSGQVSWQKENGESHTGRFVVEGEKYQLVWQDGELRGDGKYEWEISSRSKRIKRRFYDPLLAPIIIYPFRFVRLDLMAEVVRIGGNTKEIALDIEFGSSIAQGSHLFSIDPKSLMPTALTLNFNQGQFSEKAEFAEIKAGEVADKAEFSLDFAVWKKKGFTLTDMAIGESDAIWPEERALK